MEAVHQFGTNVVGFHLATGEMRWYIVVCYLSPDNTSTIESVVTVLKEQPRGTELLVTGDSNAKLSEPEGDRRGEDIVVALATEVLEDMLTHFLPRRRSWCRNRRTWSMTQAGREVRFRTDYILTVSSGMFPSGNPGITQTITWLWVASVALPLGNTPNTSGGASRPPYNHRPP